MLLLTISALREEKRPRTVSLACQLTICIFLSPIIRTFFQVSPKLLIFDFEYILVLTQPKNMKEWNGLMEQMVYHQVPHRDEALSHPIGQSDE